LELQFKSFSLALGLTFQTTRKGKFGKIRILCSQSWARFTLTFDSKLEHLHL